MRFKRKLLMILVAFFVFMGLKAMDPNGATHAQYKGAAQQLAGILIDDPEAIFEDHKVVEKDGHGRVLVTLTARTDAMTGAARIRYASVIIDRFDTKTDRFSYHPTRSTAVYDTAQERDKHIGAQKSACGWGEPRES